MKRFWLIMLKEHFLMKTHYWHNTVANQSMRLFNHINTEKRNLCLTTSKLFNLMLVLTRQISRLRQQYQWKSKLSTFQECCKHLSSLGCSTFRYLSQFLQCSQRSVASYSDTRYCRPTLAAILWKEKESDWIVFQGKDEKLKRLFTEENNIRVRMH